MTMLASLNRPRQPAGWAAAGGKVAKRERDWTRRWGRFGGILVAGAFILGLGSSCASPKKEPTMAAATAAAAQAPAKRAGDTPSGGMAGGRFVTSARVANDDPSEAPSPGQELISHALSDAGDGAVEGRADNGRDGNGVPAAAAERRVGVVRVIGAHGKFVLIETTNGVTGGALAEGQELRCRGSAAGGGAQTAVLKVARERQAPFLVADVVSGEPQAGDTAYFAPEKKNGNSTSR